MLRLLATSSTRVLEWSPQGCPVVESETGPALWLRGPEAADAGRLALFLGRAVGDGSAWVAVVVPDPQSGGDEIDHPDAATELDRDEPAEPRPTASPLPEATAHNGREDSTQLAREDSASADPPHPTGAPASPGASASSGLPAADIAPAASVATPQWMGLRDVGALLPAPEVEAFMTAQALALWHASHTHCPRCGTATEPAVAGWTRRCPADGSEHYPRTDAAVIMAVTDARDRLLMARAPAWPPGRRSVLAGFVEPGERLEAAVAREVLEEVGLTVRDITYVGSQPWPLPASLMLGFTAVSDGEELSLTDGEIAEAEWYSRDELRAAVADGSLGLPGPLSIARRLVEGWFGEPLSPPVEVSFHRPGTPTSS